MSDEQDFQHDPQHDPAILHQALGIAQDVRGRIYQLLPEEIKQEKRLALASSLTITSLFDVVCEIAYEYEVPLEFLQYGLHHHYHNTAEEEDIH